MASTRPAEDCQGQAPGTRRPSFSAWAEEGLQADLRAVAAQLAAERPCASEAPGGAALAAAQGSPDQARSPPDTQPGSSHRPGRRPSESSRGGSSPPRQAPTSPHHPKPPKSPFTETPEPFRSGKGRISHELPSPLQQRLSARGKGDQIPAGPSQAPVRIFDRISAPAQPPQSRYHRSLRCKLHAGQCIHATCKETGCSCGGVQTCSGRPCTAVGAGAEQRLHAASTSAAAPAQHPLHGPSEPACTRDSQAEEEEAEVRPDAANARDRQEDVGLGSLGSPSAAHLRSDSSPIFYNPPLLRSQSGQDLVDVWHSAHASEDGGSPPSPVAQAPVLPFSVFAACRLLDTTPSSKVTLRPCLDLRPDFLSLLNLPPCMTLQVSPHICTHPRPGSC